MPRFGQCRRAASRHTSTSSIGIPIPLILRHVEAFFQGHQIDEFTGMEGTIAKSLPGLEVIRVKPKKRSGEWVYISNGASEAMAGEHIRLEFLIISKIETQEHVKTLAAMAHYQTDPTRRKGLGDVVRLERPWMDDSPCDRLLISLPYPFGPKLEWCDHIRFLWLMPITESEHKFILEHGVEAFEEKLEWSGIDPVAIKRRWVV